MRIHRRETALLLLGGAFVISFLYYMIVISPAISKQKSLKKRIERKQSDLSGMIKQRARWQKFKFNRAEIEKKLKARGKAFSLLSFLEGISREVGINDNIQYMKPLSIHVESASMKPAGIEMYLDNINMEQLVALLYKIECSGKLLNVRRIRIQRTSTRKSQALKVTLQVNTYSYT
jgi:hypothetical protein